MPVPGAADDGFEGIILRFPAEFASDLVAISDKYGQVARSAGGGEGRDRVPGDFARRFDDLEHGIAAAAAEVVDAAAPVGKCLERQDMRPRQIKDMHVVADAGAIGCVVIGAVDFDRVTLPQGDLQDERDQMRFGIMRLADMPVGVGTTGIEVAQAAVFYAVEPIHPAEQAFRHIFRFAVYAAGHQRLVFVDRDALGLVEEVGGRGQDATFLRCARWRIPTD